MSKKHLSIRLKDENHKELKLLSVDMGIPMQQIGEMALAFFVKHKELIKKDRKKCLEKKN